MFEVVTEPEFSAWYETLPEPLAEEVTAAIDLCATASGVLEPERLSRLLLWYDGTGTGACSLGLEGLMLESWLAAPTERARAYLMWHQEVVLCLESPILQGRLAELPPALAAQALSQVERLRRKLHAARLSGSWGSWRLQSAPAPAAQPDPGGVRATFLDLLQLVGLEPRLVLGSGSGLRELSIPNVEPQLRVLLGLDYPAQRLIVILGEQLGRNYYGDSVKRAEACWAQYCGSIAEKLHAELP